MNCSIKSIILVYFQFALYAKICQRASYDSGRGKKEKNK